MSLANATCDCNVVTSGLRLVPKMSTKRQGQHAPTAQPDTVKESSDTVAWEDLDDWVRSFQFPTADLELNASMFSAVTMSTLKRMLRFGFIYLTGVGSVPY